MECTEFLCIFYCIISHFNPFCNLLIHSNDQNVPSELSKRQNYFLNQIIFLIFAHERQNEFEYFNFPRRLVFKKKNEFAQ